MGQLQERYKQYRLPQKFMAEGVYPYFRAITGKQGTEVEMGGHKVLMFGSNAYTGLTGDQRIIDAAKAAYLATLIEKEEKTVERFPVTPIAEDLQIEPVLTNKLNKLRIGLPEAYYYWTMTSRLLAK